MSIKDEVEAVIFTISKKEPVIAVILRMLGIKVTDEVETAAVSTDGWLLINPEFWSTIKPEDRVFVIVHESLHAIFDHTNRYKKTMDPSLFNIAADAKINDIAKNITIEVTGKTPTLYDVAVTYNTLAKHFAVPKHIAEKLSTEELYDVIAKNNQDGNGGGGMKKSGDQQQQKKDDNSSGAGGNSNSTENQRQKGAGSGNDTRNRATRNNDTPAGDIKTGRDIIDSGDSIRGEVIRDKDKKLKDKKPEEISEEIKNKALAEAARQKLAGNGSSLVNEVLKEVQLSKKINWKKIVKEVISEYYRYRERSMKRPNRRLESRKVFYKGYIRKPVPNLIVFIDVSGSMDTNEINSGLSEIASFMRTVGGKVTLIQWDAGLIDVSEYRKGTEFIRKGSGGTDFKKTWEDLKEKHKYIIRDIASNVVLFISDMVFYEGEEEYRKLVRKSGKFVLLKTAQESDPEVYIDNRALHIFQ